LSDRGFGKPTQTTATVEAPEEALAPLMARVDELLNAKVHELPEDELEALAAVPQEEWTAYIEAEGW
jgi:hypothetical protein